MSFFLLQKTDYNSDIHKHLLEENICVRKVSNEELKISLDETTTTADINKIMNISNTIYKNKNKIETQKYKQYTIPETLIRNDKFMEHKLFNTYNTETKLLRYIYELSKKDYTLCNGMIPLGSCTMKLNSCSQLQPLSWDKMLEVHPFTPKKYRKGYFG